MQASFARTAMMEHNNATKYEPADMEEAFLALRRRRAAILEEQNVLTNVEAQLSAFSASRHPVPLRPSSLSMSSLLVEDARLRSQHEALSHLPTAALSNEPSMMASLLVRDIASGVQPRTFPRVPPAALSEPSLPAAFHLGSLQQRAAGLQLPRDHLSPPLPARQPPMKPYEWSRLQLQRMEAGASSSPTHPPRSTLQVGHPRNATLMSARPHDSLGSHAAIQLDQSVPIAPKKRRHEELSTPKKSSGKTHEPRPKWDQRLEELKEFKAKNGHCRVPASLNPLRMWLKNQLRVCLNPQSYLWLKDGVERTRRQAVLESVLGTKLEHYMDVQAKAWDRRLEELKTFKKTTGHCRVPVSSFALCTWLKNQRASLDPESPVCMKNIRKRENRTKKLEAVLGTDLKDWLGRPPLSWHEETSEGITLGHEETSEGITLGHEETSEEIALSALTALSSQPSPKHQPVEPPQKRQKLEVDRRAKSEEKER